MMVFHSKAQFDEGGYSIGLQASNNTLINAYYKTDIAGGTVLSNYNDKFYQVNFDFRIHAVGDNFILSMDGSSIPYLLVLLYKMIAEKEGQIFGQLRDIDDNIPDHSGFGYNFPYIQTGMAFGASNIFIGFDLDLGAAGTKITGDGSYDNTGNNEILYSENSTWYFGLGGVAYYNASIFRSSIRLDKAWGENNLKGYLIYADAEFCLFENIYVGAFYKYMNLGDEIERGHLRISTVGVKMGVFLY